MSRAVLRADEKLIENLKKIIIYIKNKSRDIVIRGIKKPKFVCSSDASYKRISYESRLGYMFHLIEEEDKIENIKIYENCSMFLTYVCVNVVY